jgi:acyl-coenzyme A synthetase/AMP-(fatty) acid ligase
VFELWAKLDLRCPLSLQQLSPEQLEVVRELPRTPSGKIVKATLRERFARP